VGLSCVGNAIRENEFQNFAVYCLQPNAAIPHFSGRHFNKVRGKLLPDANLNLDSIFLRVSPVMCVFYFAHAGVIQVGRPIPLAGRHSAGSKAASSRADLLKWKFLCD